MGGMCKLLALVDSAPASRLDGQHGSSMIGYSPSAVSYACKDKTVLNSCELVVMKLLWYCMHQGAILLIVLILLIIGTMASRIISGMHHKSKPQSDMSSQQGLYHIY